MSDGESGFAHRLAYVRWLRNRGRLASETDTEVASALGVGYKWFQKWKKSPTPPEGRTEHDAIEDALKPMKISVAWLYDGKGKTPYPELWKSWDSEPVRPSRIQQPPEELGRQQAPRSREAKKKGA